MRILAVAKVEHTFRPEIQNRGKHELPFDGLAIPELDPAEPGADRTVVVSSKPERLEREMPPGRERNRAFILFHLVADARVIARIDHDRHVAEVLCSRSNQGRTADIDVLNEMRQAG